MIGYIYNNFFGGSKSKKNLDDSDIEIGKPDIVVLVDHILDRDYG